MGLGYQATNELRLSAFVPWIEGIREEQGTRDRRISGLGDVTLLAQWSPWLEEAEEHPILAGLSLFGGIEFPTGEDNDQPFSGMEAPSLFQLGNGTFNPKLGISYAKSLEEWTLFGRLLATIPLGESDAGHEPGAYLQTSLGAGYAMTDSLRLQLSVDGIFRDRDKLEGEDVGNTGSVTLSVTPALSWTINEKWGVNAAVNIPFHNDVRSKQVAPGTSFQLGTTFRF